MTFLIWALTLFVGAFFQLVVERTWIAAGVGVGLAAVGAVLTAVTFRLYTGDRRSWYAALCLPFVVLALQFWDAFTYGSGRVSIVGEAFWPSVVVVCLLLPSIRAFAPVAIATADTADADGTAS